MSFVNMLLFSILVVFILCSDATAGDSMTIAPVDVQWKEDAKKCGISEADIALLNKNRILISNKAYKQIFSPYLGSRNPFFITSDSLLNAYHVLYEESILRLEEALAVKLPDILRFILKNIQDTTSDLTGNPTLVSEAKQRAMLITGIALKLVDDLFQFKDMKLNTILENETKKIIEAKAIVKPEWLDKPDASFIALDYSRYKPRGLYVRSEKLKRHFRAVSWLQSIPFRIDNDVELLSILMLGNSISSERFDNYFDEEDFYRFFRTYKSFIGTGDDWDLVTASEQASHKLQFDLSGKDLQKKHKRLELEAEEYKKGTLINDQIRFAPDKSVKVPEAQFRIIASCRTPSAILFQRISDFQHENDFYPSGLEVAVSLGSTFARQYLVGSGKEAMLKVIDSCKPVFDYQSLFYSEDFDDQNKYFWNLEDPSLYLMYLNVLKTLFDEPGSDALDFMKTEAWAMKSCNTALAGWAQIRHTWVLQSKQYAMIMGMTIPPSGFVEPNPEFFSQMAGLADNCQELLKKAGALDPDYDGIINILENLREIAAGAKDDNDFYAKFNKLLIDERLGFELTPTLWEATDIKSDWEPRKQMERIDTLVDDIKNGKIDRYPHLKEAIKEDYYDLDDLWNQFVKVSRRLEAISHKQLRHKDLNDDENAFIFSYGETISKFMLYRGNSYESPRDDSPRIVDVYANILTGGYLHVGIARPRKLYVLYPWKGETFLCEGAIMPYCEFVTSERLTDESWKERLDSGDIPPIPNWLSPVIIEGGLRKPDIIQD